MAPDRRTFILHAVLLFICRAHRASEQVAETTKHKLREELTLLFDAERSDIISKYEMECNKLRYKTS